METGCGTGFKAYGNVQAWVSAHAFIRVQLFVNSQSLRHGLGRLAFVRVHVWVRIQAGLGCRQGLGPRHGLGYMHWLGLRRWGGTQAWVSGSGVV